MTKKIMIYLKKIVKKLGKYIEDKMEENIKDRSWRFKKHDFKQGIENTRSY